MQRPPGSELLSEDEVRLRARSDHDGFSGELYQIGVVVPDIDAGMRSYAALLGLGPFLRRDTRYIGRYREWRGVIANRNAFARWGPLYLELIEPGEGNSNAREWLQLRGPGIFHLGYITDDLEQRPHGAEVCFETLELRTESGAPAVLHLDTVAELGYFVELSARNVAEGLIQRIEAHIASSSGPLAGLSNLGAMSDPQRT
jgi:hypothetical protein